MSHLYLRSSLWLVLALETTPLLAEHRPTATERPSETDSKSTKGFVEKPQCTKSDVKPSADHIKVINETMGSRSHRLFHWLWHNADADMPENLKAQFRRTYGSGVINPRRQCPPPDGSGTPETGEDFLFMHRQMIFRMQAAFIKKGLSCLSAWSSFPGQVGADGKYQQDAEWPLPGDRASRSNSTLVQMKEWEKLFKDKKFLKGRSLSELGWLLDNTVHGTMHVLWADPSVRGTEPSINEVISGQFAEGSRHDDPTNNSLGGIYSAHVNPLFWKLHGFIDTFIDRWLEANDYKEIAVDCKGKEKCFEWKGTWIGVPPERIAERLGIRNKKEEGETAVATTADRVTASENTQEKPIDEEKARKMVNDLKEQICGRP